MGARLVAEVYERWSHLPHHAFRVLAYMALTALDGADEPLYYGGRERLAGALGVPMTDVDPHAAALAHRRAFKALDRAMRSLYVAGCVAQVGRPAPGRNSTYRLDLKAERTPLDGECEAPTDPVGRGASEATSSGSVDGTHPAGGDNAPRPVGVTHPAQRGVEEKMRSHEDKNYHHSSSVRTSRPARASASQDRDLSVSGRLTLRVVPPASRRPSPNATSPPKAVQPALWPAAVREEPDVDRPTAVRTAREAVARARHATRTRSAASGRPGAVPGAAASPPTPVPRPPGDCRACGTGLDLDGTCYMCRDGIVQIARVS